MRRHETPRAALMPLRRPIGFREQLLGIVLLSFALLMYVSAEADLRQLPAVIWPALLVIALGALRRPAASPAFPSLQVVGQSTVRRSPTPNKALTLPPVEAEIPTVTVKKRLWADAVDDIGTNHHCKFPFVLGPLVFGPHAEVMPVIDACFWPGSHSPITCRTREIILLARECYAVMNADCRQKTFIDAVMKAHEVKLAASDRPQPGYDVYRDTLTGKSSTVSDRLRKAMPVN